MASYRKRSLTQRVQSNAQRRQKIQAAVRAAPRERAKGFLPGTVIMAQSLTDGEAAKAIFGIVREQTEFNLYLDCFSQTFRSLVPCQIPCGSYYTQALEGCQGIAGLAYAVA